MNEFLDWNMLSTYAGVVLAVTLITELIKHVGFIDKIPTRLVSYVIAVALMTAALCFTAGFTWSAFALIWVNAVVVSLAANGAYDGIAAGVKKLTAAAPEDKIEIKNK